MTNIEQLIEKAKALKAAREAASRGPWECKDHPDAPFDGQFRILGPYNRKPPEAYDDRDWNGYFHKYENSIFTTLAANSTIGLMDAFLLIAEDRERLKEAIKRSEGRFSHIENWHRDYVTPENFEDCQEVGMTPEIYLRDGKHEAREALAASSEVDKQLNKGAV